MTPQTTQPPKIADREFASRLLDDTGKRFDRENGSPSLSEAKNVVLQDGDTRGTVKFVAGG